jgi:hypothetical protein
VYFDRILHQVAVSDKSVQRFVAFVIMYWMLVTSGLTANAPGQKDEEPPEVRYAAMLAAEYGPLGTTTDQILAHESTHEPATIVGALIYRLRAKPPERLSSIERKLLAVADLREEVNNGGFEQYFSNAAGDRLALALQALKEMGAAPLIKAMQRALIVFPGSKPPATPEARVKVIAGARKRAETIWGGCEDSFYLGEEGFADHALRYAKRYRAQIKLP